MGDFELSPFLTLSLMGPIVGGGDNGGVRSFGETSIAELSRARVWDGGVIDLSFGGC